jgi:hypothetical protein
MSGESGAHHSDSLPEQFSLLSPADQSLYQGLRSVVGSQDNRYNRFHRLDTLADSMQRIHAFCIRGNSDDSLRCLVCGVCWLSNTEIALNIRHLRVLLNKSKSTINGALLKMHYNPVPLKSDDGHRLMELIPQLKNHYLDLRLWSIRRLVRPEPKQLPLPEIPAPPAAPSEPQDSFAQNGFSDVPEFEFDSFELGRFPDEGTDFLGFGIRLLNSIGVMPKVFLCRRAVIWVREHKRQLPKLFRRLFAQKPKADVPTVESRKEMEMPFDEDSAEERSHGYKFCALMARLPCLFREKEIPRPVLKGDPSEVGELFVSG